MAWCVAVGCKSRSGVLGENNELIYFHYFPKDRALRDQWIKKVRRGQAWQPTKYSRLCSLHFEKSCFQNGVMDNSLLSHAVPTIFPEYPSPIPKNNNKGQTNEDPCSDITMESQEEQSTLIPCKTELKKYEKLLMMVPYYERCRCCLRNKQLQNMWQEHYYKGQREVFGEMLSECFDMNLQEPTEHIEQICVLCVTRLRTASAFKHTVLYTEKLINQQISNGTFKNRSKVLTMAKKNIHAQEDFYQEYIENGSQVISHEEVIDFGHDYIQCSKNIEEPNANQKNTEAQTDETEEGGIEENTENEMDYQDGINNEEDTARDQEKEVNAEEPSSGDAELMSPIRDDSDDGAEYLDLEFLEDDEDVVVIEAHTVPTKKQYRRSPRKNEAADRANLKKRAKPVKDVMKRKLKAPARKTQLRSAGKKLNKPKLTTEDKKSKQQSQEARAKLNEEIKTILTYTNATPYKTKQGKYFCAYCTRGGPIFEDPKSLREHTKSEHGPERVTTVDSFMRPPCHNEVLKLDIENLSCVVCSSPIKSWSDMFTHLNEKHNIELEEAYTRVIPYKLDELNCVLCDESCKYFYVLNNHMNVHYKNYKCAECPETFLNANRLKAHEEIHVQGTFRCEYCPKVFLQDKYRRKHVEYVHDKKAKFKCRLCSEWFHREHQRYVHMLVSHRVKTDTYCCGLCGKSFNWRGYYLTHMRLKHNKKEKKFQCSLCDRKFNMAFELRNHENWHKGTSDFACGVCGRKFGSKQYLKKHYKMSHKQDS